MFLFLLGPHVAMSIVKRIGSFEDWRVKVDCMSSLSNPSYISFCYLNLESPIWGRPLESIPVVWFSMWIQRSERRQHRSRRGCMQGWSLGTLTGRGTPSQVRGSISACPRGPRYMGTGFISNTSPALCTHD